MPKVLAIVQGHVALELGLAGVPVEEPANVEEAEKLTAQRLEDRDVDVLILQEDLRAGFSEWHINQLLRHRGLPLVVNCPAFEEEESDVDGYLAAVLKPAIGYEIRLE